MYPLKQFLTNPAFLSQTGTPDPLAVSAKWLLRAATTHNKFKSELPSRASDSCFSILHNNVRSLSWNLENCQVHLLDELNFDFSIIGIWIYFWIRSNTSSLWRCWLVYLWISEGNSYWKKKKKSNQAFQALWIEIQSSQKSNIICGIIYRQHNSPKRFQEYFDETLEKLIASNKSVILWPTST